MDDLWVELVERAVRKKFGKSSMQMILKFL
jgi:hypothetical protein